MHTYCYIGCMQFHSDRTRSRMSCIHSEREGIEGRKEDSSHRFMNLVRTAPDLSFAILHTLLISLSHNSTCSYLFNLSNLTLPHTI